MHIMFLLGISAFLLCLFLTPLCRDLFLRAGLVDQPDTDRKFHLRAVPRIGGIPIAISYALALLILFSLRPAGSGLHVQHMHLLLELLPAAGLIFLTGLLDDLVGLKPWQKLLGQVAAAIFAVALGVRLVSPHFSPWVSIAISIVWLIGCTNAVNLIDGMDGLATGVCLLATLTTLAVAVIVGNVGLSLATIPLAGALLAFLRYNFTPASVFLGDCGALTIGFMLGCFGLIWSQHNGTMLGMVAPLMALALPLIDVCLAIGRRYLRNVPIFQGDRGHIHHMVLGLGFSTRMTALLLYGVCCISACFAIAASVSRKGFGWPIVFIFCALVIIGIDRLGYIEFNAARKTLTGNSVRRAVRDQIYLDELNRNLASAQSADEWWNLLVTVCRDFEFASVHMELFDSIYHEQFFTQPEPPACRIHLDLGAHGSFVVTRISDDVPPGMMMPVLHHVQTSIRDKAPAVFRSSRNVISISAA